MNVQRLWIGLISFSIGLVLFFNQGNIFSYGYSPSGFTLLGLMIFQALVLIMVFGGLVLIAMSWDWKQKK
jgi:ABC-type multidrug transport system permease subunit